MSTFTDVAGGTTSFNDASGSSGLSEILLTEDSESILTEDSELLLVQNSSDFTETSGSSTNFTDTNG